MQIIARIRRRWALLLLAAMAAVPAAAAAGTPQGGGAGSGGEDPLRPGSLSLQLQVTRSHTLDSFGMLDVSMKRHLTERTALRFGVGLGLGVDNSASDQLAEYTRLDDEWVDTDEEWDLDRIELIVEALYLRYFLPEAGVSFFAGAGPAAGFSRETSDRTRTFNYSNGGSVTEESGEYARSWIAGGLALVGAECFVTRRFSIHAEYRISMLYERTTSEQTVRSSVGVSWDRRVETTTREWRLDAGDVLVGLSAYF